MRVLLRTLVVGLVGVMLAGTMPASAATAAINDDVAMNSGCDNHPGVPDWFYPTLGNAADQAGDGVPAAWGSGDQAWAMMKIICNESSFNVGAVSASGSYYGLGQMGRTQIAAANVSFNCYWNEDSGCPHLRKYYQCLAALRYANQRYDTPLKAWDFWKAHHWW